MKNNSVRSICVASDGTVLASSSSRNVANAIRRAQWLLNNTDGAVRAFVPSSQYEVCK